MDQQEVEELGRDENNKTTLLQKFGGKDDEKTTLHLLLDKFHCTNCTCKSCRIVLSFFYQLQDNHSRVLRCFYR